MNRTVFHSSFSHWHNPKEAFPWKLTESYCTSCTCVFSYALLHAFDICLFSLDNSKLSLGSFGFSIFRWGKQWIILSTSRYRNLKLHSYRMGTVGTPPPDNTWHTSPDDTWHTFSSGVNPIRISPRVHVARFSYPDYLKEKHTTLISMTSGRLNIGYPDTLPRSLTGVSKSCTLSQQPAMAHVPPPVGWKDKNEVTASHFLLSLPTISNNRSNYHDLCQPLVGWWWPCHHLVSSW